MAGAGRSQEDYNWNLPIISDVMLSGYCIHKLQTQRYSNLFPFDAGMKGVKQNKAISFFARRNERGKAESRLKP